MAQLQFKGKPFVQNYHMLVKYRQLLPRKDKSLTKEVSLKDNLILHGDNLAALKALMPQYAGKVKCIYIDPPYNTGNEGWAYNDNVTSPMMQEWLGKVVERDDLTRHDKWLCMMTPRLKLLRELLRDDGIICISMDDNEIVNLVALCDDIFGEHNRFGIIVIQNNPRGRRLGTELAVEHEYLVVYARALEKFKAGRLFPSIWQGPEFNNEMGRDQIRELFGKQVFDYPKPVDLVKHAILLANRKDGVVLDSFAGSGTTAQGVLELNQADGGSRRFVLVECEDYADRITAERVRRVIKAGTPGQFSYFDLGEPIDVERLLTGKGGLPSYADLARYLFYTAMGAEFDEKALDPSKNFIGESKTHAIHLFYEPNLEKLKNLALTLDDARRLNAPKDKRLMVFAPTKYLDQEYLDQYRIDFVQLPYEIYKAFG